MVNKKRCIMIWLILMIAISNLTGCDKTRLSGTIQLYSEDLKIGVPMAITLEVPEDLEGIYRVMWEVEPSEAGIILGGTDIIEAYSEEEIKAIFGNDIDTLNVDRIALYIPTEEIDFTIYASGFYKQTNPQPITNINYKWQ